MRDNRFVSLHRGGTLEKEQHYELMRWACDCTSHVIHLCNGKIDDRIEFALRVAGLWLKGSASVGDARKASAGAIAAANGTTDAVKIAISRSAGHAVATAHMADHSLGAAIYALKAVKNSGLSTETERKWQNEQLTPKITELILTSRTGKEKALKI